MSLENSIWYSLGEGQSRASELLGSNTPDAIFLLGGGDMSRVNAAIRLGEIYPNSILYTMSQNGYPTTVYSNGIQELNMHAGEAEEVIKASGINMERVVQIPQSTSTLTEMLEIFASYANLNIDFIGIVTNDFHIERSELIFDKLMDRSASEQIRSSLSKYLISIEESDLVKTHERIWDNFEVDRSVVVGKGLKNIKFIDAEVLLGEEPSRVNLDEAQGFIDLMDGKYDFARPSYIQYVRNLGSFTSFLDIS